MPVFEILAHGDSVLTAFLLARQSMADVSGNPAAVRQRANARARSLGFTGGSKSMLLSFKCAPPTQGEAHFWQANSLSVE